MRRNTVPFLGVLLLAGCVEILPPSDSTNGLPEGLEVSLVLDDDEVMQHAPFTALFTATNTTRSAMQIVTSHGCLVLPGVYRNGVRVPFKGSAYGCTAAITTHVFAPGETKTYEWSMRAELYAQDPGDIEGAPAPTGSYMVRVEFELQPPPGSQHRPRAETTLVVR
ncbi:MAG TPA: hypothetical protein VK933_03580 [Longimicrobiales bacterium]|nr:hypothetical protein [Longimicrobiales bacterium]